MKNRRKLKRRHLIYYLRVHDCQTRELLGHLVDITTEGVMLITEKAIETERDFELKLDLPSEIFDAHELRFTARSIRCRPDVNPDFFSVGFQLIDYPREDMARINRLIDEYGFSD